MQNEFKTSMMEELKFFLGIQIHESLDRVFINETKYTRNFYEI